MPAGPRNPYANAASHPGYQFALAQGVMAANVSFGVATIRPEWALRLSDAPMIASRAYADAREQAYHPTVRLSVIRKYGFGGRR